jgi:hypothetical protein
MLPIFLYRVGLSFFGEGTKLLVSDIQYAWKLLLKAVQGYILKPRQSLKLSASVYFYFLFLKIFLNVINREVNAIRRTGKDLLTIIPFTIILIIPLTPVGHVFVFSFIQVLYFLITFKINNNV